MTDKKPYQEICEAFRWEDVLAGFDWNPSVRFNMAHEICDRYAADSERVAVHWIGKNRETREYSYAQLS